MSILRTKQVWIRPESIAARIKRERSQLSPVEQANVRRAIQILRKRMGTRSLADAMGMSFAALAKAMQPTRRPVHKHAVIAARVAQCTVDAILSGAWPEPTTCPHCNGRGHVFV